MNTCNFCKRRGFSSPQSVYAHLKWCPVYSKHKQEQKAASSTSLREAVPKGRPQQAMSVPIQPPSPPQPRNPTTSWARIAPPTLCTRASRSWTSLLQLNARYRRPGVAAIRTRQTAGVQAICARAGACLGGQRSRRCPQHRFAPKNLLLRCGMTFAYRDTMHSSDPLS